MPVFSSRGVERRPDPPAWETNDVPVIAAGTALWAAALVVLLVLELATATDVHGWWLAMCGCGIGLGLIGVRYCRRRQAALARRGGA
jgi:hypothetical protein